jgi:hypothetical protein
MRLLSLARAALLFVLFVQAAPAQENSQTAVSATPGGPARFAGIFRAPARNGEDPTSALGIADPAANSPGFKFLVFFPDGRVKRGLIRAGFDNTIQESDWRLSIAGGGKDAAQWGRYQFAGGRGVLQFASAIGGAQLVSGLRGDVWNVVQYPDNLLVNGDTYSLLSCPTGLRLNGLYKPFGDSTQPGITFTVDNQFIDQGILDSNTATAVGGGGFAYAFGSPKAGRGVYTISNCGLNLRYANGVAPPRLFFLDPGTSPDNVKVLYIQNVKYQRVQ